MLVSTLIRKQNQVKVSNLINFNSKSKDLTIGLKPEIFHLNDSINKSFCYWDLAEDIGDYFAELGLVNIGVEICGSDGHYVYMINVHGRSPTTGQRYHVLC